MSTFRKRPVIVEAVQFTPENHDELINHLDGCIGFQVVDGGIMIPTLEGDMLASPGDWIIKGVAGEFYPCKPEIFAATHEAIHLWNEDLCTCGPASRNPCTCGAES